jgi:hypothetical protein
MHTSGDTERVWSNGRTMINKRKPKKKTRKKSCSSGTSSVIKFQRLISGLRSVEGAVTHHPECKSSKYDPTCLCNTSLLLTFGMAIEEETD